MSHTLGIEVSSFFDRLCLALQRRRNERRTIRELNALSDRDLHDIGISRYEIAEVARNLQPRSDSGLAPAAEMDCVEPVKVAA
jgi:uncharacterized protein YjiS (DUF1127 family)